MITAVVIGWQSFETRRAAFAANRSADATRDSVDTLVQKDKAKISAEIGRGKKLEVKDWMNGDPYNKIDFSIEVTNHGTTSAYKATGRASAVVTNDFIGLDIEDTDLLLGIPRVIKPDATVFGRLSTYGSRFPRKEDATSILNREKMLCIYGSIDFVNAFGKQETEPFFLMYLIILSTRDSSYMYGYWTEVPRRLSQPKDWWDREQQH